MPFRLNVPPDDLDGAAATDATALRKALLALIPNAPAAALRAAIQAITGGGDGDAGGSVSMALNSAGGGRTSGKTPDQVAEEANRRLKERLQRGGR